MRVLKLFILIIVYLSINSESAKILCLFLLPVKSHNLAFIPLTKELLNRGHKIVSVTVDPIYSKDNAPANITEIDIHDISYKIWSKEFKKNTKNKQESDIYSTLKLVYTLMDKVFIAQCKSDQIKNKINEITNEFDLIIYNSAGYSAIAFSYIYKAPVITFSSAIVISYYNKILGFTGYEKYYVSFYRQTIKEALPLWETFVGVYEHFSALLFFDHIEKQIENTFKKTLALSAPPINELFNNLHMYLSNLDLIWDSARPIPSNLFNLGHIQKKAHEILPTDVENYLNSSKNGVIYISFGTNILSSTLPPKIMNAFIDVISQLSYDVLWKWDNDEMPSKPKNLRIFKWLPQADVLNHPKIKLFITQAGQLSTDEAIDAGVPLIGIPQIFDQFTNAEKYELHGIGKKLDINSLTSENLKDAIESVIGNESYRHNAIKLRNLLNDKPMTSMETAIWAIEYVLRHGGAHHIRSLAFNLSWAEYFEFELLFIFVAIFILLICVFFKLLFICISLCKYVSNYVRN